MKSLSFPLRAISRWLALALLIVASARPVFAQRMVVNDQQASPVVVESAVIRTEITGRIAVTTFDLVFRNPNNRVLEGTFEFPLLDGQQVVSFALDVNGRMRAAVPVEKDRGRIVFEEIERRRVDPGLLEQTAGNNYRARVYPIPARGTRRVTIGYQENLARDGDSPVYRLPLNFDTPLENFDLSVSAPGGSGKVTAKTTLPVELPAWEEQHLLKVQRRKFVARGLLELSLPRLAAPRTLTEKRGDTEYFLTEVPLGGLKSADRPTPRVIGLLWDASASGEGRDHARELAVLDAWFASVRQVEVRLVVLRNEADAPRKFTVKNGDWSALRRALEEVAYDGATSFDGLEDDTAVDEWLLFSDGLVNYGVSQKVTSLPLRAPVHTILSGTRTNSALLRGLARRQAGEFVNLQRIDPVEAARLLRSESVRVLDVSTVSGRLGQVFPEVGTPVEGDGMVVAGILRSPSAVVRLRLGTSAESRAVELTVGAGENAGGVAARAWATNKIAALEPDFEANREDIRRTSVEFGIVTAETSLIVLETLQDYVRYNITPPPELQAEWTAHRQVVIVNQTKQRNTRLDQIAGLWSERKTWWMQKFPKERRAVWSKPLITERQASAGPVPPVGAVANPGEEDILVLTPFEVSADEHTGYTAASTLAGTRLNTELRDIGQAVTVINSQFLKDIASSSSGSLQQDTTSTEATARGPRGNFSGTPDTAAEAPEAGSAQILLRRWAPNTGYIERLRRTGKERRYAVYLEERGEHRDEPGFFLETAGFFFSAGDPSLAARILSNLAELQLDDPALLRVLAHRLMDAEQPALALPIFERVLKLRPEEPQSRRDLALVCAKMRHYQRAVDLLWEVVADMETSRFPEIELIAIAELNAIVATCNQPLDLSRVDPRFHTNLPVGLRVVLTWDTDACDIDLWVEDPDGERAVYSNPRTYQGGRLSRDYTAGYGPEEFMLRDPKPGRYIVRINYFGDSRQTALGPVTAQVRLITGFGTPAETEKRLTVRLVEQQKDRLVGAIDIPAAK